MTEPAPTSSLRPPPPCRPVKPTGPWERVLTDTRVAGMSEDSYPVQWTGRQAVVALPEHIDPSNAGQIREQLLLVINRGAAPLIVDMTATASCDHAGADAMMRAYQRTVASGTQLRLVVTAQVVKRVLSVNGLDHLIPVHPSVQVAIAAGRAAPGSPHGGRAGPY